MGTPAGPNTVAMEEVRHGRWVGAGLVLASVLAVAVHLYGLYRVTGPPTPEWFPHGDKVEHAVGFGMPVLLILVALRWYGRDTPRRRAIVVGLFAAHAVVSELMQQWLYTSRQGDPRDAVADVIGVGLGWLGYRLVARRTVRRRR